MRMRLNSEQVGVDRHTNDRIDAHGVEVVNLPLTADSACHGQMTRRQASQSRGGIDRKTLHQAFAINVGVKVSAYVGIELRNGFVGCKSDLRLPSFYSDATIFGVDAGDEMF